MVPDLPTAQPPNSLYPVALNEWRGESRNLSQTFTREGQHYWRYVRPGTYPIGGWTDVDDNEDNDATATLDLPGYWMGKYPVTVQQYREFINAGGYDTQQYWIDNGWAWKEAYDDGNGRTQPYLWNDADYNSDDQPVVGVTWYEAMAYVHWLNTELADVLPEGYQVQLPTEAEWEVACAYDEAGQRHTYPWGEQAPSAELADGRYEQGNNAAAAVGGRPAGAAACGAHDMVGSVWEWNASSYDGYAAKSGTRVADFMTSEPNVPLRGASWYDETDVLLCAARDGYYPNIDYHNYRGFRLVLSP